MPKSALSGEPDEYVRRISAVYIFLMHILSHVLVNYTLAGCKFTFAVL